MDYIYNRIMHGAGRGEPVTTKWVNFTDIVTSRGKKPRDYKLYDSICIKSKNSHD